MGSVIKKDVPIRLGPMVSVYVTIESAVDKEADKGTHHYCTGEDEARHPAQRIKQRQYCEAVGTGRSRKGQLAPGAPCGKEGYRWQKGRENEAGEVVLLTAAELEELEDPATRSSLVVAAHPLQQVLSATVPGETVYYLRPGTKSGAADGYAGLSALLRMHPELALVAVHSTRSKSQLWRLALLGDVITLQSLCWPEDLYGAPPVPLPLQDEAALALADQALAAITMEFDPRDYVNVARQRRAELLASKAADQASLAPVSFIDQLRAQAELDKPKRRAVVRKSSKSA